ncbi:MAG: DUF2330 domain-containing protein [bacterium]
MKRAASSRAAPTGPSPTAAFAAPDAGAGGGGVQVLSREAVGPFDIATLLPETVDDLRAWLDDNGYQIPPETDATLQPYVARGLAFVAVKLLPDRESGDISPLRLSFSAQRPAIPIVPTSVAANPDMGIIVHVLGEHRAIPVNYRHVVINETAIDWQSGGQNYPDVVSQAADEADGQAFATDYAGPAGAPPQPYGEGTLIGVREATTGQQIIDELGLFDLFFQPLDADLQRVLPTGSSSPTTSRSPTTSTARAAMTAAASRSTARRSPPASRPRSTSPAATSPTSSETTATSPASTAP